MSEEHVERITHKQASRTAAVVASALLLFNVAFYFLSALWFEGNPQAEILKVRIAFAVLTGLVAGASFLAAYAPRLVGHGIGQITAIAALVAGVASVKAHKPAELAASLFVIGVMLNVVVYFSMKRSRAAWSVLSSTLVVLAIVTFFGAPKIRSELGIGIWTALIAPGLLTIAVISLGMVRREYKERSD